VTFKIDVREDGVPVRWTATDRGATATPDPDYRPAVLVAAREDRTRYLDWLADELAPDPKVAALERVTRRRDLRADEPSPMLRVELDRLGECRQLAREVRARELDAHPPGTLSLYDVDLDPQFRYCLDTGADPLPDRRFERVDLSVPDAALAEGDLSALTVDGDPAGGSERGACRRVERVLDATDPDVLVLSSAELVPLLAERGVDLGRRPGYRTLAGASTYTSYGRVGHSPARYDVPGRVVVDRRSSFLLDEAGFAGLRYLVARAGKPLQELARDSIGGVLTAIEVREARGRGVPAPWQKRQTEDWKSVDRLHAADRGGFTFQPEAGVHGDVHELDFASLYPNIICEFNLSPETVRCPCHDRADVPELGYSVCDSEGYLSEVLQPIIDDRAEIKARLAADSEPGDSGLSTAEREALEGQSSALKWILVSCFGYQGFSNAKFGRIEVHEAINASARDILLTAKERLEASGWRVLHGIVDSIWVTPREEATDRTSLQQLAEEITGEVGIALEYEGAFEWVAFCPRRDGDAGALTRYFGRRCDHEPASDDPEPSAYKYRGIECRQRSTCTWVADVQRELIRTLDRSRDPEAVCDRLAVRLRELRRGAVSPAELVIRTRASKDLETYSHRTRTVAVLERAADRGLSPAPGQDIQYVVVDDDRDSLERVRLVDEIDETTAYDPSFYRTRAVRAAASVLSAVGWGSEQIEQYLSGRESVPLSGFRS